MKVYEEPPRFSDEYEAVIIEHYINEDANKVWRAERRDEATVVLRETDVSSEYLNFGENKTAVEAAKYLIREGYSDVVLDGNKNVLVELREGDRS